MFVEGYKLRGKEVQWEEVEYGGTFDGNVPRLLSTLF